MTAGCVVEAPPRPVQPVPIVATTPIPSRALDADPCAPRPAPPNAPNGWWLGRAGDDAAVFSLDFTAAGTGSALLRLAADNTVTGTLDGAPLAIPQGPAGREQFRRPVAVDLGPSLAAGEHRLELRVVNIDGCRVAWRLNPAGVAFAIDERGADGVHRIAASGPRVQADGHAAFEVPPDQVWTREVGAPWIWKRPAG